MTAIATGENHVLGSEPASEIQTEQVDTTSNSNVTNTNTQIENNESCAAFPSNYYTIPLITSEVCTNQNCDLNVGNTCNYLMAHVPNAKDVQTYTTSIMASSTIPKQRTSESNVENSENMNNRTILPPPVFDSITNESNTASDKTVSATKYRTIGKRYHRTIPRQFTAVDPIINPLKNSRNNIMSSSPSNLTFNSDTNNKSERLDAAYNGNKQLSCQCPVQHTPMTYLSSHSLDIGQTSLPSNEATSTGLSSTQIGQMPTTKKRISIDAARHVNLSHHAASAQNKPVQASSAHCKGGTLRKKYDNGEINDKNVYSNNNLSKMQIFLANDKAIEDAQPRVESQPNLKKQNSLPRIANLHDTNISLKPMYRNGIEKCEYNQNAVTVDTSMHISTIIQQSSSSNDREAHRKPYNSAKSTMCVEPNPELPPKMYKHNTSRLSGPHQKSYYSNSKTHAISKPSSDGSKFSIPDSKASNAYKNMNKLQKNNYSKSLPRKVISASHEYAQASRSTTQFNNSLQNSNSSFNTLPNKTKQISTRTSNLLTEVVNKVPSVINIPSPLQPHQPTPVSHHVPVPANSTPVQLTSIISNNIRSQQATTRRSSNQDHSRKLPDQTNLNEPSMKSEKPLPVLSTYTNCANPKEHFLPNDNSLDEDYLSECENCKSAHGSRYYLEEEVDDVPQETMTLQRKMPENEDADQQNYYRVSSTLPTNTSRKTP